MQVNTEETGNFLRFVKGTSVGLLGFTLNFSFVHRVYKSD